MWSTSRSYRNMNAGPSSQFKLFGQGISRNSCYWNVTNCLQLPEFQLYGVKLWNVSIHLQWEWALQVKAKTLLLTLYRSGTRKWNPRRDDAHTTFFSSSCSFWACLCAAAKCGQFNMLLEWLWLQTAPSGSDVQLQVRCFTEIAWISPNLLHRISDFREAVMRQRPWPRLTQPASSMLLNGRNSERCHRA